MEQFDIFLAALPGLEPLLAEEAAEAGFAGIVVQPGGAACTGGLSEVWRANLELRGASRVLVRIAAFRALHLAQLDKRSRKVDWGRWLRPDVPVKVEASCRKSRIYHAGAAVQRVATAITEELGAEVSEAAALRLMVRIEDDLVTISLDTSGAPLHRRGHKEAVGKAPLRETMAAMFLRSCRYRVGEPVLDPMCGSGTLPIEAAEIAAGLQPGRSRRFAFEEFAGFDAAAFAALKRGGLVPAARFYGSDRDAGAVRMATQNAARSGVGEWTQFDRRAISDLERPEGAPGLVMVNPPYGGRIGEKRLLYGLYGALGAVLKQKMAGWRLGLVTSEPGLARAAGLDWAEPGPQVAHGGMRVQLWQARL